jgi:hypothetical protein
LGDALKSWQSLGADATQDVSGIEGASAVARVAGETLQRRYGGSGIWAEDCEGDGGHFQMESNPVGLRTEFGLDRVPIYGDSAR